MATTPATDAAEITSRILLETKSVLFSPEQPFTFTSGRSSPVYIDCRRLISFPRARRLAGGETAGIPFAAWIAERLSLPMLYVRKKPKGFGRNAQIEGEMAEGARILLVEDLASEGSSKLNFVRAIRQAGGEIGHSFVIFNYGIFPKSMASLEAEQVKLHWLATWWDVLRIADQLGYFSPDQFAAVKAFLDDPDGWSAARGSDRSSASS